MKNNIVLRLFLLLILSVTANQITGQTSYAIESEAVGGSGIHTPFWMMSKKHGLSSATLNNGYIRVGIVQDYKNESNFSFRYGLDVVKAENYTSEFILQQAYFDVQFYNKYELSMGSKEIPSLFKNQELSSGSMCWSGNARPIPMIRFSTNDFISYPWLFKRMLKVKAVCSFGWFTDGQFQKDRVVFDPKVTNSSFTNFYNSDLLYHQKELYLKLDLPKSPWSMTIGMEMKVQFGGDKYYYKDGNIEVVHTPATLKHYWMAFFPSRGDNTSAIPDQQFIFGNTVGTEHVIIEYKKPTYQLKGYLENFFEDFGGMAKKNGLDGLWGIEYANKRETGITDVVLEYLQTTNQGGAIHWAPSDYPGVKLTNEATGNDDYYNNGMYTGWEHWGMTNGNPLLSSPIYNTDGSMRIENNRVKAYHLGISGRFNKELEARLLTTYTDGWGRHYQPFLSIKSNYSAFTEFDFSPQKLNGWKFTASAGLDRGTLYGNNQALLLKISKKGMIFGTK
ncbi:MAG: capsule assembly Wzi family protein [Bacteroidales bacterium]